MTEIWELIKAGGVTAALFVFIWAGVTKRIAWGYQLKECEERSDAYQAQYEAMLARCFTLMESMRVGVSVAEKAIDVAKTAKLSS